MYSTLRILGLLSLVDYLDILPFGCSWGLMLWACFYKFYLALLAGLVLLVLAGCLDLLVRLVGFIWFTLALALAGVHAHWLMY